MWWDIDRKNGRKSEDKILEFLLIFLGLLQALTTFDIQ